MRPITIAFWLVVAVISLLWLSTDSLFSTPPAYFSLRKVFVQYSGIMAIAMMSLGLWLATRPRWIEKPLNGLDKMYRLHKWLGIAALIFSVLHWWWVQGSRWMVSWGWLIRPAKNKTAEQSLPALELWLKAQKHTAEFLGEWTFYLVVLLIALALLKWVPYHWFRKTHKWLAAAYLVLVYHALILTNLDYWSQPLGWCLAILLLTGSVSAIMLLTGRIGRSRKVSGTIDSLTYHDTLKKLEGSVTLAAGWPGHLPGQFAFVDSATADGAHPFTIASAWSPATRQLKFIIKELGDHTRTARARLKIGMSVTIEGPYGCFDFQDSKPRQIWIAGGIGITPFLARLDALAQAQASAAEPNTQSVTLFRSTRDDQSPAAHSFAQSLQQQAEHAGITLITHNSSTHGRLNADQIIAQVNNWQQASIWFCGPSPMGEQLRRQFIAQGLPPSAFHSELFEMR